MTRGSGRTPRRSIGILAGVAWLALLSACVRVEDPSDGLPVADGVGLIDAAPRSEVTAEAAAAAFALNTRATDVQRQMLETELVGHQIEWNLRVFEVAFEGGRYKVTSQAIPVSDPDAVPLLRVVAFVLPRDEKDDALLRAVKTDDVLRLRGVVQEIQLRTVVVLVPAVAVGAAGFITEPNIGSGT